MEIADIFDAHVHIIDPVFPLVANNGFLPEPFTVEQYLVTTGQMGLDITGGAVVSGSFQVDDQQYLQAALATLGPGWVGVTQLPEAITDQELFVLNAFGVRAVRFNLARGLSIEIEALVRQAIRVNDLFGWHVEAYVDAVDIPELAPSFNRLPRLSIDHLGLSAAGLPHLLHLVERGVRVKATGFGRITFDIASALQAIDAVNPQALMFGTDLPGTRAPRAFEPQDLTLIADVLGSEGLLRATSLNARFWYGLA